MNKHLTLIYDIAMIQIPIETLHNAGITDIYISLSHDQPELFMKLLGKGEELGVNLSYIIHGEARGISYGIWEARHFIGDDPFVCILGDNYFTEGIKPLVNAFSATGTPMVYLKEVDNPSRYGVPIMNNNQELTKFVEKPKNPQNNYAVLGVYCLTTQFFKNYSKLEPSWRGEYEITDALNLLLPDVGYAVYGGEWMDLGTFDDIYRAATWRRENVKRMEGER